MTILTVLGYLVLVVLAWAGGYVFIFTASRAWHDGKALAKSDTIQEIRRLVWSASLNTNEIVTVLQGNTERTERILTVTEKLLDVTGDMNRSVGHLLNRAPTQYGSKEGWTVWRRRSPHAPEAGELSQAQIVSFCSVPLVTP